MKQRKTEHPILMCRDMVRAILDGTKTETRRMAGLKELNEYPYTWNVVTPVDGFVTLENDVYGWEQPKHPYGVAGDTLWVRENFRCVGYGRAFGIRIYYSASEGSDNESIVLDPAPDKNDKWRFVHKKRPGIHMPRWASRITLTVKDVILERLHEITDEGAKAEGVADRAEYEKLWVELNGEESWNLNPWVWVVKFDVREVRK